MCLFFLFAIVQCRGLHGANFSGPSHDSADLDRAIPQHNGCSAPAGWRHSLPENSWQHQCQLSGRLVAEISWRPAWAEAVGFRFPRAESNIFRFPRSESNIFRFPRFGCCQNVRSEAVRRPSSRSERQPREHHAPQHERPQVNDAARRHTDTTRFTAAFSKCVVRLSSGEELHPRPPHAQQSYLTPLWHTHCGNEFLFCVFPFFLCSLLLGVVVLTTNQCQFRQSTNRAQFFFRAYRQNKHVHPNKSSMPFAARLASNKVAPDICRICSMAARRSASSFACRSSSSLCTADSISLIVSCCFCTSDSRSSRCFSNSSRCNSLLCDHAGKIVKHKARRQSTSTGTFIIAAYPLQ